MIFISIQPLIDVVRNMLQVYVYIGGPMPYNSGFYSVSICLLSDSYVRGLHLGGYGREGVVEGVYCAGAHLSLILLTGLELHASPIPQPPPLTHTLPRLS